MTTVDIMNRGMRCLIDNLGIVEAETFIATVIRERFDYTEWQRGYFDAMTSEELNAAAVKYAEEHPFRGQAGAASSG